MYELRLMSYAIAVADNGGFTKAAEQLGITQPTLSHQIKRLEKQVGTPLFDRLGKRLRLTATGDIFIRHARDAIRAEQAAKMELSAYMNLNVGTLRIGAIQTYMYYLLPKAITQFHQHYPKVKVSAIETSAPVIEQMIAQGKLDLGLAFMPPQLDENSGKVLFSEELVLISNIKRTQKLKKQMPLSEISQLPMAALNQDLATRQLISNHFKNKNLTEDIKVETYSVESLLRIIMNCDLVAIVPEIAVFEHRNLCITKIKPSPIIRQAALIHSRGAFQTPPANQFRKILSGLIKQS